MTTLPGFTFRCIACALLLSQLPACMAWRVQQATPQQVLEIEPQTAKLRVTLSGGSWVVLQQPVISGDSLLGVVEEGEYLGRPLRKGLLTGIPLDEVVRVAVLRRFFYGIVDVVRLSPNTYPAISPESVTVFMSLDELWADTIQYEEIATVFTYSDVFIGNQQHLRRAREEAARLGANGIIGQGTRIRWFEWLLVDGGLKWEQAITAIRWAVIPPEMRRLPP